jgi:hypothetical protein
MKIAYNSTDIYGSDGLWVEADSHEAAFTAALQAVNDCGFEVDDVDVTTIELAELATLSESEFDDLASQWGLSHNNGWTSDEADAAIRAEFVRRGDDVRVSGNAANRLLSQTRALCVSEGKR